MTARLVLIILHMEVVLEYPHQNKKAREIKTPNMAKIPKTILIENYINSNKTIILGQKSSDRVLWEKK